MSTELSPQQKAANTRKANKLATTRYENVTSHNAFTEGGRCGPGETVLLTEEQAAAYKGLRLCEAK